MVTKPFSNESSLAAFRRLGKELPLIKQIFRVETLGLDYLFAPDYSEIYDYISPKLSKPLKRDIEQELRFSLATKALLELTYKKKILIPPYARELNLHINYILNHGKRYDADDLLDTIDYYLNDRIFQRDLDEFDGTNSNSETIDNIINLAKIHEKKLSRIFDILSRLEDVFGRFGDLSNNSYLEYANKYIKINSRDALENSNKYYEELELIRKKANNTLHSSLMDGWAIQYLIKANQLAINNYKENKLVIFVTRSSSVRLVVGENMTFYIPDINQDIKCIWSPNTFLAYYIFLKMPNPTLEIINNAITELSNLYISSDTFSNDVYKALDKYWGNPNILSEEIENISHLTDNFEKIPSKINTKLLKNLSTQKNEYLEDFSRIIEVVKEKPDLFREKVQSNLQVLWGQLERVDNIVSGFLKMIDFQETLPTLSIESLNDQLFLFLKLLNLSVMVYIPDIKLATELSNQFITRSTLNNLKEREKEFDQESFWLLGLFIDLYESNFSVIRKKIAFETPAIKNKVLLKEIKLLELSVDYLQDQISEASIEACKDLTSEHPKDPRFFKLLSLIYEKIWNKTNKIEYLRDAATYSRIALLGVRDKSSDFRLECINNKAYIETELFEHTDDITLSGLENVQYELKTAVSELYLNKILPPEIYHTMGKLEYVLAIDGYKGNRGKQIDLLSSAKSHLVIPLTVDDKDHTYKSDYEAVLKALDEIVKST